MPITSTTSRRPGVASGRRGRRAAQRASARARRRRASSVAARAAERAVSGRRAPGIATTFGREVEQPRERDLGRRRAVRVARPRASACRRARRRARGAARRAASARSARYPRSTQRSTTPPRSARSSNGLSATCTAAIGASSSASSSWPRFTFATPTRGTRPSSTSRASARTRRRATASAGRARGGGRGRSGGRRAPRGSPRSRRGSPSRGRPGPSAPAGRAMPPFVTIRARVGRQHAASARASSRSLWPSSFGPRPYARAVSNTVTPAPAAAAIVASARSSSRSASVESRMQPRPIRSSAGGRARPAIVTSRSIASSCRSSDLAPHTLLGYTTSQEHGDAWTTAGTSSRACTAATARRR